MYHIVQFFTHCSKLYIHEKVHGYIQGRFVMFYILPTSLSDHHIHLRDALPPARTARAIPRSSTMMGHQDFFPCFYTPVL